MSALDDAREIVRLSEMADFGAVEVRASRDGERYSVSMPASAANVYAKCPVMSTVAQAYIEQCAEVERLRKLCGRIEEIVLGASRWGRAGESKKKEYANLLAEFASAGEGQ